MKATKTFRSGAVSKAHRDNQHLLEEYAAQIIEGGKIRTLVTLRTYYNTRQTSNSACVWVHGGDYACGSGKATGYGYHRTSAAAQYAIIDAGYTLSEAIDGRGDRAIEAAVIALAKTVTKKRNIFIHKSNG